MGLVFVEIRHVDVLPSSWEIEAVYGRPLAISTSLRGCCQCGNELPGSVQCGKLHQLRTC